MITARNIGFDYNEKPQGIVEIKSHNRDFNLIHLMDIINEQLVMKKKIKILELGCGGGRNLRYLKNRYGDLVNVYGIDLSKKAIEYASKNIDGIFILGRTTTDIFNEKSFDVIIMFDILEHLSNISEVEETIKLAQKKLKQDGILFISCPIENNKFCITWLLNKINFIPDVTYKYYGHNIQFTEPQIIFLIKKYFVVNNVNYNVHFLSQINTLIFFYIPKEIICFFGGKKLETSLRESNVELKQNNKYISLFHSLLLRLLYFIKSPFDFIVFYESRLRMKSKFGAMNINIECRKKFGH